jgi:endonuclease/exonuclease/phosphatase family metal-dependent hydrolase
VTANRVWRRVAAAVVSGFSWVYFVAVLALWTLLWVAGDRWWIGTVALFGPRWIWGLPLAALAPAAALTRPRLLWPLLLAAVVIVGPVMGLCVPWRFLQHGRARTLSVRVLTCNLGGGARPAALAELIATARPDIVAIQEGSVRSLPAEDWPKGWDLRTTVASRYPIRGIEKLNRDELGAKGFVTRFDIETPGGIVHFFNLHLQTVREGLEAVRSGKWKGATALSANIALRERQSAAASRWLRGVSGPVVIAGDFNMPADSDIYQQFWSSYCNAFSSAGLGYGYTRFTRWHGVRIDHVLTGPGWRCRRCWVGSDVGSDHLPVLAELDWTGPRN